MYLPRIVVSRLLLAGLCLPLAASGPALLSQSSVRSVKVLGSKDAVEIEVESSDRLVPQTRVLTGPDRLVVDFPNAIPGAQLRNQSVNRGQVKDVRFGLLQSKPPVTRIVLDLKMAQSYQIFPYGRTTIIKVMGGTPDTSADNSSAGKATRPSLVVANYTAGAQRVQIETVVRPPLEVSFRDGLLAIRADKATLSEVLLAVQQRTGADVGIAAGAEQEQVVVNLGPAPAPEVLAQLLNGSKFNFLILSAANDPRQLDRVILTPRTEGGAVALAPVQSPDQNADAGDDGPPAPSPQGNPPQPQVTLKPQPEANAPSDDNPPQ